MIKLGHILGAGVMDNYEIITDLNLSNMYTWLCFYLKYMSILFMVKYE